MKMPFSEKTARDMGWVVKSATLCLSNRRGKILNEIGNHLKTLGEPYMCRYDRETNRIDVAADASTIGALNFGE